MLKRPITYKDFDNNEVTDIFYFNITETEIIEMEVEHKDGLEGMIKRIIATEDRQALIAEFKRIILLAIGEKSPDGKRFIKNEEIRTNFAQSAAFNALFIELATNDDAAVNFIKGIIPTQLTLGPDAETLPPPNIQPAENIGKDSE